MTGAIESELTQGLDPTDAERFEREARHCLVEAGAVLQTKGQRERHRLLLEEAVNQARRALSAARVASVTESPSVSPRLVTVVARARSTLAEAYRARAEDACHGASQLSLSAQRAPTRESCDEGWARVELIVQAAESAARACERCAAELEVEAGGSPSARAARAAAERAERAAHWARRLVDERNPAYTFHSHGGFSFGEGWYLAAAAVLAGVTIQIEPGQAGTAQAEHFLRAAGLGDRLAAYRPRPCAMKHTTAIVGSLFRADPVTSRQRLRAAFLGDEGVPERVARWVDARLALAASAAAGRRKVLLWIRDGAHHPGRNTRLPELLELTRRVESEGLVPVWTGDAVRGEAVPGAVIDLILFWKDPLFRGVDTRRAQLAFFEHLRIAHGLVGQVGVTTAGMDGPALLGLPTLYLTDAPNVRMREWVGAVPGYREVVREHGYLERVSATLREWALT